MSIIEAILLGIIQGLSEFIPISSTAHLTIAGKFMGLVDPNNPEQWTAFIAVTQLGTLAAVLVYFANDIRTIPATFLQENFGKTKVRFREQSTKSKMAWYIVIGSIPIVLVGLGFKDIIESNITKDPYVIAASLIVLGVILFIAEKVAKFVKDLDGIKFGDAIVIGFAQCLALIPGASRSGTTITAGLFMGLNRETAARFSFLLSIPAVFGSGMLEFYHSLSFLNSENMLVWLISAVVSGISGYAAIAFLINYLRKRSTLLFVIYRIVFGIVILIFAANNIL